MRPARVALIAALVLPLLAGCASRLTAENYAKLRVGMSYEETTALLGRPDQCSGAFVMKSCTWGDQRRSINVNFVGDKVVLYTAENIR
ncbi:MAG TPA: hypothetical protein VFR86_09145 [Burkholderiaceae bacterium]|nr:hypothetical protein [Burkholderiaceae bacterium]